MAEVWDDWKQSSRSLAERIKSNPGSCIQTAGAEFYRVKGEVWFGWASGNAGKHKCIGIIREAKKEDGIRLLLHLDPEANLIYDPKVFPNGNGRPFRLSAPNLSDWDRGEILLTPDTFPNESFSWITCAIRHTATARKPMTILSIEVLSALVFLEQQATEPSLEPKNLTATERKRLLCIHKRIERSGKLVKEKSANCHRMLHRRPYPTIEALRRFFE